MPKKNRQIAEINVVPYIDVMLVLLVIFMITAPLLFQGVNVNLPTVSTTPIESKTPEPIVISIDSYGNYYLNIAPQPTQIITEQDLLNKIKSEFTPNQEPSSRQVLIKGDKDINYGKIMQAMALLQNIGINNIGLITRPPDKKDI